ncbi:oligoendopeptidase, M3 family [Pseudobutyrivibrio sp. OR37]|uniref:M3 family oligoendopeptidase n=1 Tax=Pseudobutyrivibrio sp. OR37 TaxID=1798186 RepID=UPI0008F0B056|nr:M3 family oligoendopeptidase [Pseudobutyrivibrio sp. OR37]SFH56990.1 oligoendopeptidase, M3 family [Pseudobutyrivibrio sp. OR37]
MKCSKMPYQRIDMDEVKAFFEKLIADSKNAKSGEEQFELHKKYYEFMNEVHTNRILGTFRHDCDTSDEFYTKENDYLDEIMPLIYNMENDYKKVLFESPYKDYLEEKISKVAFKNMELANKSISEKILPLMQEENALVSRYDKIIASAKIPFDGEEYNLSLLRKFLTAEDRDTRKRAWKAYSDYFTSVTDEIDEIFDKLVKNRTKQAKELGYDNFVELGYNRMNRNAYRRAEVENFRKQVKESFVPFVCEIQEIRRKQIGVDALKYYDNEVFYPNGNPAPTGTPEEILKSGQEMYRELSPETAEFFDFMTENELFDVLGRKTKKQGGYMDFLPKYKAPIIFANFNGTSGDVDVITHECGHAFQGYVTRDDEIKEHNDLTMETAEIHSMSMEYFTYQWMDKFFGDRADEYRKMHFMDAITFVPYGCMVDEFQHIIYDKPELTPAERKAVWADLEKQYRPWLDYEDNEFFVTGGWWQKQGHIFWDPFYYIDYVLASVVAMEFKVWMDKDFKDAWNHYLELCKLSVKDFYEDELKEVGLDSPFADGTIKGLVENLKKKL